MKRKIVSFLMAACFMLMTALAGPAIAYDPPGKELATDRAVPVMNIR